MYLAVTILPELLHFNSYFENNCHEPILATEYALSFKQASSVQPMHSSRAIYPSVI